ncbi:hypothetical protein TWF718_005172 [Orbilia javanica]|uniref:Nephrocystin 3-like N-terminal domain-containing protein n=1 Tax=Orbilia javanica TaxID=47235 RepID=A0AAN8MT80_9PEZI
MDRQFENEDYTIGWICALAVEFKAALAVLDERHPQLEQGLDDNAYAFGQVGCYNVVIACLPSGVYGVTSAANVATLLHQNFPAVKYGLMVGIGGGAPMLPLRDIRLGDVVVSEPVPGCGGVLQYDFGKTTQEGRFVQTGFLNKPPSVFLKAITKVKAESGPEKLAKIVATVLENEVVPREEFSRPAIESDRLFRAEYDHPITSEESGVSCTGCDTGMLVHRLARSSPSWPYVHYGLIASGNQVMKHGITRDRLSREKGVLCFEMEAAGLMDDLPSLVIRGICDYSDSHKSKEWQPYAALAAAAFARELLLELPVKASLKNHPRPPVNLNLPTAKDAIFGSYTDQDEPECLPGTRVGLLDQVTQWAHGPERCMFWLVGRAGTGKSTISRTVARKFENDKVLGASFFFKRGEADRANGALLFTTLAVQLANRFRGTLVSSIQAEIEEDPNISRKALKEQFDKLIFKPLSRLDIKPTFHRSRKAKIIILIDALDECDRKPDTNIIVNMLSRLQEIKTVDVRVFLTSRPDLPILPAFQRLRDDKYQRLILHEVLASDVRHDILLFLENEMLRIREDNFFSEDWPGDDKIQKLVDMAVPLFIYAATLCRFIGDEYWDPQERIDLVLKYETGRDHGNQSQGSTDQRPSWHTSQLRKTYLPILDQLVVNRDAHETEMLISEFQQIVGAIVNFASPLSISSLANLLSVSEDKVERRLKFLHSVLNVPSDRHTPIRLFHASFRDFLLQEGSRFRIDEEKSHWMIASRCLELMSSRNGLKRNICCLKSAGTLRSEIEKGLIDSHISSELQYACLYWIYHITKSHTRRCLVDSDQIHMFLQNHLLNWLEATSLLGKINETLGMVDALILATEVTNGKVLSELLYDIRRFVLRNRYIIDEAPLQTYYSAIVFLPENSLVRRIFRSEKVNQEFHILPKVSRGWDSHMQTFKGPGRKSNIIGLAISLDGKLLASVSCIDSIINIWDAITGAQLQMLEADDFEIEATVVSFSPNSHLLASGLSDGKVRVWETTGALLHTMKGHTNGVLTIAFSLDGKFLASGSYDETIRVWDPAAGVQLHILEGHTDVVYSIAFSPDGRLLASSSGDSTVRLWDTTTWAPLRTLGLYPDLVRAVTFSPDGRVLALVGSKVNIRLWDTVSWMPRKDIVRPGGEEAWDIVFSPDGKYVALCCVGRNVKLFDADMRKVLQIVEGDIMVVAFYPDSGLLASGQVDGTIKIWDVTIGEPPLAPEAHKTGVSRMILSPDKKRLISSSGEGFPRNEDAAILWDAVSGAFIRRLSGCWDRCIGGAAFSPNSEFLVVPFDHERVIGLLDLSTGDQLWTVDANSRAGRLAFSHDSKLLASAFNNDDDDDDDDDDEEEEEDGANRVSLWDVNTGELLRVLEVREYVSAIYFSPDGKSFVLALAYSKIVVWSTTTWMPLRTLEGLGFADGTLKFSADSRFLAASSRNPTIWLCDAATGALLRTLDRYRNSIRHFRKPALAFSPDGKLLASMTFGIDGGGAAFELWEPETGAHAPPQFQKVIRGFPSPDFLTFSSSPDGQYINTAQQSFALWTDTAPLESRDLGRYKVIGFEREWLTRSQEKLIWIPEEVTESIAYGNAIALGCASGQVLFFKLNSNL